jgi:hypothetical protein
VIDPAERRKGDPLTDWRLARIEAEIERNGSKLDKLENRINYLFGGLALMVAVVNLAVPIVIHYLTGGK